MLPEVLQKSSHSHIATDKSHSWCKSSRIAREILARFLLVLNYRALKLKNKARSLCVAREWTGCTCILQEGREV